MSQQEPPEMSSQERIVNYHYPLLSPTPEKIGTAASLLLIVFLGYGILGTGYIPGVSGTTAGGVAWFSVILLLATAPLYLSGLPQYLCHELIFSIIVIALVSYIVACYITIHNIKSVIIGVIFYLFIIAVLFKIFSFFYLPPICG